MRNLHEPSSGQHLLPVAALEQILRFCLEAFRASLAASGTGCPENSRMSAKSSFVLAP